MIIFVMLAAMHANTPCTRKLSDLGMLDRTKTEVIYASAPTIPVTEGPRGTGGQECVRFIFSIDEYGRAQDIQVAEDSDNIIMNMAGYKALLKYKFKPNSGNKTFSIIFEGRVGGLPPGRLPSDVKK